MPIFICRCSRGLHPTEAIKFKKYKEQKMQIKFFKNIKLSNRVLIAGVGGGFDIASGIPLYRYLCDLGKEVVLAYAYVYKKNNSEGILNQDFFLLISDFERNMKRLRLFSSFITLISLQMFTSNLVEQYFKLFE